MKIHVTSQSQGYSNRCVYITIFAQREQSSMVVILFLSKFIDFELNMPEHMRRTLIATDLLSVVRVWNPPFFSLAKNKSGTHSSEYNDGWILKMI